MLRNENQLSTQVETFLNGGDMSNGSECVDMPMLLHDIYFEMLGYATTNFLRFFRLHNRF